MIKLFWAWIPVFILFVLSLIFGFIPVLVLRLLHINRLAKSLSTFTSTWISNGILKILNIHVHKSGNLKNLEEFKKNGKKICYISNHTSMLDIPLVEGALGIGCGFILKSVLIFCPIINIIAVALDCVFINRKSLKKSAKSINKGVKKIEQGTPMLIFPEGTRSKTGKIGAFKHGSFKLATKSSAEIIPIVIKGIRVGLEDRKKVFSRVDAFIHVDDSIPTENLDRDNIKDMELMLERRIVQIYNGLV